MQKIMIVFVLLAHNSIHSSAPRERKISAAQQQQINALNTSLNTMISNFRATGLEYTKENLQEINREIDELAKLDQSAAAEWRLALEVQPHFDQFYTFLDQEQFRQAQKVIEFLTKIAGHNQKVMQTIDELKLVLEWEQKIPKVLENGTRLLQIAEELQKSGYDITKLSGSSPEDIRAFLAEAAPQGSSIQQIKEQLQKIGITRQLLDALEENELQDTWKFAQQLPTTTQNRDEKVFDFIEKLTKRRQVAPAIAQDVKIVAQYWDGDLKTLPQDLIATLSKYIKSQEAIGYDKKTIANDVRDFIAREHKEKPTVTVIMTPQPEEQKQQEATLQEMVAKIGEYSRQPNIRKLPRESITRAYNYIIKKEKAAEPVDKIAVTIFLLPQT